jgi:hypothetical protein
MKTGFKDPIAVKEGKKVKNPWNFDQPSYDERTSCYVNAGTNYGVGHRQPVGRSGNPKSDVAVLPKGRVNTMKTDYVHHGKVSNVEVPGGK